MSWIEELVTAAHGDLEDEHREALWNRGVSETQIRDYRLGYLGRNIPDLGYPDKFLRWYDRNLSQLQDVFLFPLTTPLGDVRGLQVRSVSPDRKGYLDYIGYKEEPVFFGLSQAMPAVWATQTVVLVEGAFDLFPIQRHFPGCVATLHAGVPPGLWRIFRRMVQQIWLIYDNDATGRKVSYDILKKYRDTFDIKIFKYPNIRMGGKPVKDPADLWKIWGDEHFGVSIRSQLDPFGEINAERIL